MGLLAMNCWWRAKTIYIPLALLPSGNSTFTCRKFSGPYDSPKFVATKLCSGLGAKVRSFARRNSVKKLKRQSEEGKNAIPPPTRLDDRSPPSGDDYAKDNIEMSSVDNLDGQNLITIPSRGAVLQACTVTSGLIAALGVIIRQVSHTASVKGLPILDCSKEVSFSFEMWHLQLITGLLILISSCRYLLLKTWPDFSESSEAANQQILTPLQPLDYMVVAFLPGVSEELLFRGALLPLFGLNWKGALVVATLFGVLHLGSGRKTSFAIWATFVGFAYAYATIVSSSIIVPMVSHAANNLVGGVIWSYTSKSSK